MLELRLILLGVGILVILGIWAWARFTRFRAERAARKADAAALAAAQGYTDAEVTDDRDAFGPALGEALSDDEIEHASTVVLPPLSAADVRRAPVDPPIITLDDLPDDITQVELTTPSPRLTPMPVFDTPRPNPPVLEPLGKLLGSPRPGMRPTPPPSRNAMPWPPAPPATPTPSAASPESQVLERPVAPSAPTPVAVAEAAPTPMVTPAVTPPVTPVVKPAPATPAASAPAPAPAAAPARPTSPASAQAPANDPPADRYQRIVSVRLVMLSGRLASGEQLAQAFRAENLAFGRYKIFHRMDESERPLFSVASLVEPGSFDPDTMTTERYLGVSMFAVFPGPRPAPEVFDELVATGRRLATRLGAALQDDTGQSIVGQRLAALREDLVRFESMATAARTGRRPD